MTPKERATRVREIVLASSGGVSVSDVAALMPGVHKDRVAQDLRSLATMGIIAMGGDRRFARYAATQELADACAEHARKTAPGPIVDHKQYRQRVTVVSDGRSVELLTEIRDGILELLKTWRGLSS